MTSAKYCPYLAQEPGWPQVVVIGLVVLGFLVCAIGPHRLHGVWRWLKRRGHSRDNGPTRSAAE